MLTREEFQGLAEVPAEVEWFANIRSSRTRREYSDDLKDFMRFVGIERPEEFRIVTRSHVIAWREDLTRRKFADASVRRKLSALSSLFEYLCEKNAVTYNPVKGVKRPNRKNMARKCEAIEPGCAPGAVQIGRIAVDKITGREVVTLEVGYPVPLDKFDVGQ